MLVQNEDSEHDSIVQTSRGHIADEECSSVYPQWRRRRSSAPSIQQHTHTHTHTHTNTQSDS